MNFICLFYLRYSILHPNIFLSIPVFNLQPELHISAMTPEAQNTEKVSITKLNLQ